MTQLASLDIDAGTKSPMPGDLVSYRPASNTGRWYPRDKQMKNSEVPGDTILATAEFMINVLLDSVPTGLDKGLYTMRGYNMPIVKNKNEAISADDIYTKTRLFENYSAPATTLP